MREPTADEILETHQSFEKSLRVPVNVSHDEIDRIVVNRLISIRNLQVNKDIDISYIDKTIRYFLTESEFNKYAKGNRKLY